MNGYHVLEFPLIDAAPEAAIQFLPYGTRVLKVRVTNPAGHPDTFVMRSAHTPIGFGKTCAFTHEDQGTDFRLSWGGGHEHGACLLGADRELEFGNRRIKIPFEACRPLPPEREAWVYLNLQHVAGPPDVPRTLTLTVHDAEQPWQPPRFRLRLRLMPPVASDPVRLRPVAAEEYAFTGSQTPVYLPRWWSPAEVRFVGEAPPEVRIRLEANTMTVMCRTAQGMRRLMELFDHILAQDVDQGRAWDADLFHFGGPYFALRLWFFWLWPGGLTSLGQEIPDVERFDLVFHGETGQVAYVATDTHWHESWTTAPEDGAPVQAHLGLFSRQVLQQLTPAEQRDYEEYLDYVLHGSRSAVPAGVHIPALAVAQKLGLVHAARAPAWVWPEALRPVPGVLEVGLEAHVPYFSNCPPPPPGLVSSDPREG